MTPEAAAQLVAEHSGQAADAILTYPYIARQAIALAEERARALADVAAHIGQARKALLRHHGGAL